MGKKITSFLKKHRIAITIVLAIILIFLGVRYLLVESADDSYKEKAIQSMGEQIDLLINQKKVNQEALTLFIEGIKNKDKLSEEKIKNQEKTITDQKKKLKLMSAALGKREKQLAEIIKKNEELTGQENFPDLNTCKGKYTDCVARLKLFQQQFENYMKDADEIIAAFEKEIDNYEEQIKNYKAQVADKNIEIKAQDARYKECKEETKLLNIKITGLEGINKDQKERLKKNKRSGFLNTALKVGIFIGGYVLGKKL